MVDRDFFCTARWQNLLLVSRWSYNGDTVPIIRLLFKLRLIYHS